MRLGMVAGVLACGLAMQGVAQQNGTPPPVKPAGQAGAPLNIPETMGPPDGQSDVQSQRQRIPLPGDPPPPPPTQRQVIPSPPVRQQQPPAQVQSYPPQQQQSVPPQTVRQSAPSAVPQQHQQAPVQSYQTVPQAGQQPIAIPETMGPPDVAPRQVAPGTTVIVPQNEQPVMQPVQGQRGDSSRMVTIPPEGKIKKLPSMRPFSRAALGVYLNSLGPGAEIATPMGRHLNLRAGANFFRYGQVLDIDGVSYNAQLNFNSGQVQVDYFPMAGGFHISPGVLYSRNGVSSVGSVPPGGSFELGSQSYINSVNDPVHGTATVAYPRNVAPLLTIGWGNLIPRTGRHWAIPVELGAAYTGAAQFVFDLMGTACPSNAPANCVNFATDPAVKQNVAQEQVNINELAKRIEVYPIFSIGVSYSFGKKD